MPGAAAVAGLKVRSGLKGPRAFLLGSVRVRSLVNWESRKDILLPRPTTIGRMPKPAVALQVPQP